MDTRSRIDRLLRRLDDQVLSTPTKTLYATGVKTKLQQARFSLDHLRSLEYLIDSVAVPDETTAQSQPASVEERISYYCDCFWDFLRSSLDILGQLVNQICSLNMQENTVDLKRMAKALKREQQGSALDQVLDEFLQSRALKQLEEYRHCSTHRRPIYFETKKITRSSGTPGYYSGGSAGIILGRYLCTNPADLTPLADDSRPIVSYCELLLQRIEKYIDRIVNSLT